MDKEFQEKNKKSFDEIEKQVSILLEQLEEEANEHAKAFWAEHEEQKHGVDGKNSYGTLGVRVNRPGSENEYLSIEWFIYAFSGPKNKKKVYCNHISKGDGFSYKKSALRLYKLNSWEKRLFTMLEPSFANIRERYDHLLRVRKSTRSIARIQSKSLELL